MNKKGLLAKTDQAGTPNDVGLTLIYPQDSDRPDAQDIAIMQEYAAQANRQAGTGRFFTEQELRAIGRRARLERKVKKAIAMGDLRARHTVEDHLQELVKQATLRKVEIPPETWERLAKAVGFTADTYARTINSAVSRYFRDGMSEDQFTTRMHATIEAGLQDAWDLAMQEHGLTPEDMTDIWRAQLAEMITREESFLPGFTHAINLAKDRVNAGSTTIGDELATILNRGDLWGRRFEDIYQRALRITANHVKAIANRKKRKAIRMEWKLGQTGEHCETCRALDGVVAYAYEWDASGYHPRNPDGLLACHGFNCDCTCEPTNRRRNVPAGTTLEEWIPKRVERLLTRMKKYDPSEPRDEQGRWTDEGATMGKWKELHADATKRVSMLQAEENRYKERNTQEIYDIRTRLTYQMDNAPSQEEKDKAKARYADTSRELARRIELDRYKRRQNAIEEGMKTGKLTITEDEMAAMLANAGDVYIDHGHSPKHEYDPDLFRTSDLSGKPIRHYVTLPDGRIAHPDELTEAQRRKNVVVVKMETAHAAIR